MRILHECLWLGALAGVSSARMRGDGQSPLYLRAPMKALSPVGSMSAVRQHTKGPPGAQGGIRRVQSPGPTNGAAYSGCRSAAVARQTPGRGVTPTSPSSRGRLPQTPRRYLTICKIHNGYGSSVSYLKLIILLIYFHSRSLGMTKPCAPISDESWKDGCYWSPKNSTYHPSQWNPTRHQCLKRHGKENQHRGPKTRVWMNPESQ